MPGLAQHLPIFGTIVLTVYSQLVIRWQVPQAGPVPDSPAGKAGYLVSLLFNPWVMSALAATFLAGLSWMLAMARFELSYAYPFVGLVYVLVVAGGWLLFQEPMTMARLAGTAMVIGGIVVIARG